MLDLVFVIPVTGLYQVVQGGTPEKQGTWIHPKLATRFAIWLSDDFGLMVEEWVQEWGAKPKQSTPTPALPSNYKDALKALIAEIEAKELLELENKLLQQENEALAEAVDELFDYSSIVRVAKFNKVSEKQFNWRSLKAVSLQMDKEIKKVPDPNFGEKNIYSHDVWRVAYPGVKLPETTTLVISR